MSGTAVCPTCGAPVSAGARFCASCGSQLGTPVAEERKLATILFADVTGSTDLGEQLDPERVRAMLQDYFGAMSAIVATWGGTVEKYIGDAILAVWGVPAAREDDPIRALHAAHDMFDELERLNDSFEARHGVRLGTRIGVNTGEVLSPVGAHAGGQLIVSGDSVNIAARLEQAAEAGTALVGERTWLAARGAFEFEPPIELNVKGKRDPIVARKLGAQALSDQREASRSFQAPMLGRERELSTLVGLLDETLEGEHARLVVISGPAGIGKSRLLRELIAAATERVPNIAILRGRCLQTGRGVTFWPLGEIIRQLCGILLDEPADSAASKLAVRAAGPLAAVGLGEAEIRETIAALATSASLTVADNPLERTDPEEVALAMSRAWPRLLTGLARSQPLAVLIEDIHWADERMLRMIEAVATRSEGRILIVATSRPEFIETNSSFGSGADMSVVALRPLTDEQSQRLIAELLGSAALPLSLVEEIQRKADGNPFFVEELIQRLIDEDALVQVDGHWQATNTAADVRLPDTIHALLAARIDALTPDEKRLVQEAAVVGRVFWPGALRGGDDEDISELLRRVERRGLIAARPTSTIENEPEYIFRHVLIRDVAYASVPKKRRARAHAETGRWIETLAGDRRDEFAELIAFHYGAAVSGDDVDLAWEDDAAGREEIRQLAVEMLSRAGSATRRRFALDRAIELHEQALAIAATDAERAMVHEELGDDHEAQFHGDETVREYLAAVELLPVDAPVRPSAQTHEPELSVDPNAEARGRLTAKAGRMVLRWGAFHARPPLEEVQALVIESLDTTLSDRTRAMLFMVNGGLLPGTGGIPIATGRMPMRSEMVKQVNERIESIQRGLDIARRLDDVELLYLGTDLLAIAYQVAGDYISMREAAEEQAKIIDRLNSVRQQVDSLVSLAMVRTASGAYGAALNASEEAFKRSTGLSPHERMHAAYEIFAASEPTGDWERIEELLPWFAESAAAEGDVTCASVRGGPALGATVLARRGDGERALAMVPLELEQTDEVTFVAVAHRANFASLVGEPDVAREMVKFALAHVSAGFFELGVVPLLEAMTRLEMYSEIASLVERARDQQGAVVTIAPALDRAEGAVALARGDAPAAGPKLRAALARFEELGLPYEVAQTQVLLAKVADGAERDELLAKAAATYDALGAARLAAESRKLAQPSEERLAH